MTMARDDRYPDEGGMDRRTFVKGGLALGTAALAGSLVVSAKTLMPPPIEFEGEVNEGFVFAKGDTPNPFGFDRYAGKEAKVENFAETWAGAATLWRALFDVNGEQIPGTGFPVLLIKVDPELFRAPPEWTAGDYIADAGIVAIWDRCVHLCCLPQWHLEKLPPAYQDYEASRVPRTSEAGEDPIWCRCHNSQYDPATFVWDVHPDKTLYIAANLSHGPATRGLPVVSIKESAGRIVGGKFTDLAPEAPAEVRIRLGGAGDKRYTYRDWYFAFCR